MINNLLLVLSLAGVSLGSIACCILLFSNNRHKYANRLMALILFGLVNILLVTFLFEWNPDFYAYIYRFPSPLLYSIFPAAYLYTRAIINIENSWRKKNILHFLPSLFYLIEMLPHYFSSYEYRLQIVHAIKNHSTKLIGLNEGILPPYFHITILCVQALVYIIATFMLLQEAIGLKDGQLQVVTKKFYGWIKMFVCLTSLIAIPTMLTLVSKNNVFNTNIQPLLVTFTLSFLVVHLYLFFQPEILYGISRKNMSVLSPPYDLYDHLPEKTKQDQTHEKPYSPGKVVHDSTQLSSLESYKPNLESYMKLNTPFLKQGFSIYDLSRETAIPQHHLSALLNRVYKMRFTDFINGLRICYIKEHFGTDEWENLTLEGIAKHAGFSSRTTFFNAIKKTTGITPSAFLSQLKKQQSKFSVTSNGKQ